MAAIVRQVGRDKAAALAGLLAALLVTSFAAVAPAPAVAAGCANAVACENQLPGTDPSVWDINGYGDPGLQGFATDTSVDVGGTISFKITSAYPAYSIDIYRVGYYQGNGARKVASVTPVLPPPQQPTCLSDAGTGLTDCGNWSVSASWAVPATAVSGVYFARLYTSSGAASHILFVVRNDASTSDILLRTDETTWQAYNHWSQDGNDDGNSLYVGSAPSSDGRAYKVSFNRPYATRGQNGGDGPSNFFWYGEYPMARFLEANGYDVSYMSEIDPDRYPNLLLNHKVFLNAGHDEYWSAGQRTAVQNARDHGVDLAFFTGNEVFWKVRWESSIDGSSTPYRTLVCYKETKSDPQRLDPDDPPTWTGTWRDPTNSPPADGGKPENQLTGTIFEVNRGSAAITVPYQYSQLRFWRNTAVASLSPGQSVSLGAQTLGYEWDEDLDNGFRPAGLVDVSSTTVSVPELLVDYGNTYIAGTATHHLTLYKASSGALVFGAGTVQWSWGLDVNHDISPDSGPTSPDPNMQQATVNLLADMHAQPTTLISGLVAATASTDTTPPTSTISAPASGSAVTSGAATTISGSATDSGGGVVAAVEVSTDGGTTWHPATGTTNWSYPWTPGAPGSVTIKSRATDDSGNLEIPSAGVTATVNPRACPCTLFLSTATPTTASANDSNAVELGVKFTADNNGYVYGISFYKGSNNTGTHVADLWTSSGTLLATGTFTNETSSGWQTYSFPAPVPISAKATYIASYHTSSGGYAVNQGYFTNPYDVWPLHAPSSGSSGGNGVYAYSSGPSFPNQSFDNSNYWVDIIYNQVDTVPPVVTGVTPAANSSNGSLGAVTAQFSKSVTASSIAFTVASGGSNVPGTVSYNSATLAATFTPSSPLAQGTTYTATVSGATDSSGNKMASPFRWSFQTATCPCTLFSASATPKNADANDAQPVELGVRFHPDVNGYITGLRFYKGPTNTGTHAGNLWSSNGTLLATAAFTGETSSGWQQVSFPAPVAVTAQTTYIASYHTNAGNYAVDGGYFANGVDSGPLHAPASSSTAGNGLYGYGSSAFPTNTYQADNYWVDPVFNTKDTVPPAVTAMTPAANAANLPFNTAVTATFSKPVTSSSISFTLQDPTGATVPASLSYNSAKQTATLQPSSTLQQGAKYTANLSGATDASGNVMSPLSWSFTTLSCSCTIFGNATPANPSANDPNAVEVGVKFQPAVNGHITGIRLYKGASNTGTHVGNLWSSGGQLLATATFVNETASGWQTVTFSAPVAVSANTTYVASYHTSSGGYAADGGYFNGAGAGSFPVTAPASGASGGNGVYIYGANSQFPSQSYNATNYWVDVDFTT